MDPRSQLNPYTAQSRAQYPQLYEQVERAPLLTQSRDFEQMRSHQPMHLDSRLPEVGVNPQRLLRHQQPTYDFEHPHANPMWHQAYSVQHPQIPEGNPSFQASLQAMQAPGVEQVAHASPEARPHSGLGAARSNEHGSRSSLENLSTATTAVESNDQSPQMNSIISELRNMQKSINYIETRVDSLGKDLSALSGLTETRYKDLRESIEGFKPQIEDLFSKLYSSVSKLLTKGPYPQA